MFAKLSRTYMTNKLIQFIKQKDDKDRKSTQTVRDQIIFKEGDPADYVYIVRSGEFQVLKTVLQASGNEKKEVDIKQVLKDPRANRQTDQ